MPDNEVFSIYEDKSGRLWFATLTGKPCFYYNDSIYSENNLPFLKECDAKGMIINLFETDDGKIAYCSTHKIILIDLLKRRKEERSCGEGIIIAIDAEELKAAVSKALRHQQTGIQEQKP